MNKVRNVGRSLVTCGVIACFVIGTQIAGAQPTKPVVDCHPQVSSIENAYIVGYGSLISSVSKNSTVPNTGENIPVNVKGYSRNFNCKGSSIGLSTTFLGVDKDCDKSFNGVVFQIPDLEALQGFDRREIYYCREKVKFQDFEWLTGDSAQANLIPNETDEFWIYVVKPEAVEWPSEKYPIVQSYVDVFLTGCLEMEKTHNLGGYGDKCVNTTKGWGYPWVNDRVLPRRPWVHQKNANSIDALIQKHLPERFGAVDIEQEVKYNFGRSGSGREGGGAVAGIVVGICLLLLKNVFGV